MEMSLSYHLDDAGSAKTAKDLNSVEHGVTGVYVPGREDTTGNRNSDCTKEQPGIEMSEFGNCDRLVFSKRSRDIVDFA